MKALFLAATLSISSSAFAASSQTVVKAFEEANGVTCHYTESSKNQFCFNSLCTYKLYYACSNESSEMTLVLKIRSVTYPGGLVEKNVTDSYVQ